MKFFDSKRNRVIIASVVLLVVVVVTAIVSFSTDTLPDYEIVETEVSKAYDKLNAENNDNTIFEKYYLTENYIKRIKRNTSIEDFKKEVKDDTIKFLKDGKEIKEGLIGTGMILVRNEIQYDVYVSGDINGNGILDIQDISSVIEYSKNDLLNDKERIEADINEDGFINKDDVALLSGAFIGKEYDIKPVITVNVPDVKILNGIRGEESWYIDDVQVSVGVADKYRIRGTNPVSLTNEIDAINLDGFNAYKVEAFNYTADGNISGISSIVVKVDDREIEPIVEFSSIEPSGNPVVATIKFNKENVFVSNNDRSYDYTFYAEGEFTFEYFDVTGRSGTKSITVDWFTDVVGQDGAWRYTRLNKDEIYLREYLVYADPEEDFVVPAEYDGYKVYGVGNNVENTNVFGDNLDTRKVELTEGLIISNGIKEIEDYAFYKVGFTATLTLGNAIEHIGRYAFSTNFFSMDLIIPDSVTSIEDYAFSNSGFDCMLKLSENLTVINEGTFSGNYFDGRITIPDSVIEIKKAAFAYSESYAFITLGKNLKNIGDEAFADANYSGDLVIPDSVETIGEGAFGWNEFDGTLTLGSGLKSIGGYAFIHNRFTGDLTIPNDIPSIGDYTFFNNLFNGTLTLGNGLKTIGEGAFNENSFDSSINLPNGLETIGISAFANNNFYSLNIPGSVKTIGDNAFMGSMNRFYQDITIPATVTNLGEGIFNGCEINGSLIYEEGIVDIPFMGAVYISDSLIIPKSAETIADEAFYNSFISDLVLPVDGNLKSIGAYAFYEVYGEPTDLVLPNKLETIGDSAFSMSTFNGTLTLNNNLKTIGDYAFAGSDFSGDLTIPDSVTRIGKYAFADVGFDGKVTIGKSLTEIPEYAFFENDFKRFSPYSLTHVKKIEQYAFANNYNLVGDIVINDDVLSRAFINTQVSFWY